MGGSGAAGAGYEAVAEAEAEAEALALAEGSGGGTSMGRGGGGFWFLGSHPPEASASTRTDCARRTELETIDRYALFRRRAAIRPRPTMRLVIPNTPQRSSEEPTAGEAAQTPAARLQCPGVQLALTLTLRFSARHV